VKTTTLITNKVTIEITTLRIRNSSTVALAAQFHDVPLTRMRPSGTPL
jgi:hypothetical protein